MSFYNPYNSYFTQNEPPRDVYCENDKLAKRAYSRTSLSLVIFNAAVYTVVLLLDIAIYILARTDLRDTVVSIVDNVYFTWALNALTMYAIGFPIAYLVMKGMKKHTLEKKKIRFIDFLILIPVCELVVYVGSLVGEFINGIIGNILGFEIENSTSELVMSSPMWVVILMTVILAPIFEELLFRKLILDRLAPYGVAMAIVVSAFMFGLFHANFSQFFYAFGVGLVLGYVYVTYGDIRLPILLHMVVNFLGSVIPILVTPYIEKLADISSLGTDAIIENLPSYLLSLFITSNYTLFIYGLVGLGAFLLIRRLPNAVRSVKALQCDIPITKGKGASCVFSNAGMILFLIVSSLLIIVSILSPAISQYIASSGA